MTYSVAVDIGGTFTDAVLHASNGDIWVGKALTTHEDLLNGILEVVHQVTTKAHITPHDIDGLMVHATTVVTNAIIERKGGATALVSTKGFADVLLIRNEWRYDMFDMQLDFPEPIVPESLSFTIDERMQADGTVLRKPDDNGIEALAQQLHAAGATSVAICLLNSYANPENERLVAEGLAKRLPRLFVSASSEVAPQIREYLRASTTTLNAYAVPITKPYLQQLTSRLREVGIKREPLIMLSNGGVVGSKTAGSFPVRMIESGPAAGALAAAHYAARLGLDRMISFDMGGTTAKACLIEHYQPLVTGHFEVDRVYRFKAGSGLPVAVPSVDMIEIGAGGGSIASIDQLGLLRVGPRSAGSFPGPACYGRGGKDPTVTDANLLLGLLDANNFLGGEMILDVESARNELTKIGKSLGMSAEDAARGVYQIVSESMALAARSHAAERGVDYRNIPLLAFGGGGPLHACAVGDLLDSSCVIFPPNASVLSAFGTLVTPPRIDLANSMIARLDQLNWQLVDEVVGALSQAALTAMADAGCDEDSVSLTYAADLRYVGQQFELTVPLTEDPRFHHDAARIKAAFEESYRDQYKLLVDNLPVHLVSWRVTAEARFTVSPTKASAPIEPGRPHTKRRVELWSSEADVWWRSSIAKFQVFKGPALIEERETTTIVPPGWTARMNESDCIVATKD